jgi:hypothetical protein
VSVIDKKSYVGYLLVGFLSLFGGISIFALVIVPDRKPESGVPRDVQVLFTEVFSNQSLIRTEMGRYTPALNQLGVEEDRCKRFSCLLTISNDGLEYTFQLSKENKTWLINSKSPMPQEKK